MKLDLLVKRKKFIKSFESSVEKFISYRYGLNSNASWVAGFKKNNVFIANKKLNIVYSNSASKTKINKIVSEYSISKSFTKQILQKVYFFLFSSSHLGYLLAFSRIKVTPWKKAYEKICLIPGNHKLRVIDFSRNTSIVVSNDSSEKFFFSTELELRLRNTFLLTPKIITVSKDSKIYEEELISGLPLNKIEDQKVINHSLKQVQENLNILYVKTKKNYLISKYIDRQLSILNSSLAGFNLFHGISIKEILMFFNTLYEKIHDQEIKEFLMVQSHGDLQDGNIVYDQTRKKTFLIDWEFSEERSIYYDSLVLFFETRSPKKLLKRFIQKINCSDASWKWCEIINGKNWSLEQLMPLFLIEELVFKITMSHPVEDNSDSKGFRNWFKEASAIVRYIEKQS